MEKTNKQQLWEKLFNIRNMKPVFKKNGKSYNYTYVTEDELLAAVLAGMTTERVFLYPKIVGGTSRTTHNSYDKTKQIKGVSSPETVTEKLFEADMIMTWVDVDTGFELEVPWSMVGQQDDSSKAFGSATTYSNRYFLLKFFGFATTKDDPDNWTKKNQAYQEDNKLKATLASIDSLIQKYKTNENREAMVEVLKENTGVTVKGEPNANHRLIKNLAAANRTLSALEKFFKVEKDGN